jgi:hypothetical protein
MSRAFFEVAPIDDRWVMRMRMPSESVFEFCPSQAAAIYRARELGRHFDAWRVRVLSPSGELEKELISDGSAPVRRSA